MTRKPSPAASKKRESEQRKERELFSWHSPFPLGGESERTFFAFFTLVSRKHTLNTAVYSASRSSTRLAVDKCESSTKRAASVQPAARMISSQRLCDELFQGDFEFVGLFFPDQRSIRLKVFFGITHNANLQAGSKRFAGLQPLNLSDGADFSKIKYAFAETFLKRADGQIVVMAAHDMSVRNAIALSRYLV